MLEQVPIKKIINEVQQLQADRKFDHAMVIVKEAVGQHPEQPQLLYLLSANLMYKGDFSLALVILHNIVRNHPKFAEAWGNLGVCYKQDYHIEKAREAAHKALALHEWADPYNNLAGTYVNEGCPEGGIAFANKAIELAEPEREAKMCWNKALLMLELGQWEEGFALYQRGLDCEERLVRKYSETAETPLLRNLDDLKPEHTIVVYGEQGMGDEIMFLSALQDLIDTGANVILDCHPRMVSLFNRSFPDLEIHGTRKRQDIVWPLDKQIDWCMPAGSLFYFFRKTDSDFPRKAYIKAETNIAADMRASMNHGGKPIIGLAFTGGTKKTNNQYRCLDKDTVENLAHDTGCHFVSLEYSNSGYLPKGVEPAWNITQDYNYDVTAALVEACDAVVSINTSVVHLAGAMGKRVFTLTPSKPAWRYGINTDEMIFYPEVHQYRQLGNNWRPAIQRLRHDLNLWLNLHKGSAVA